MVGWILLNVIVAAASLYAGYYLGQYIPHETTPADDVEVHLSHAMIGAKEMRKQLEQTQQTLEDTEDVSNLLREEKSDLERRVGHLEYWLGRRNKA